MMTFRCLLIGQSLLLIHHRHFWSQISTIKPYHCIRNDLIKSHFRRLRFDQNNSGLMNGPDSISDPVARRLHCTESYPSARSSAQLNLARLNSTRLSSARGWWRGRWAPLCWRVSWLDADMACQLCMLASCLRHDDVIIIRVWHMGRVIWYSGRVSPSGRRRRVWRVARVCACGQSPRQRVMARADVFGVRFRRGFQQWLRLFLLYTVVWSKHNFDNFHFWAKSNTPLNHVLWYQLLGNPAPHARTGGVLIVAQRKLSTLR